MSQASGDEGPDLSKGVSAAEIAPGSMLQGHVGDAEVMLARSGDEWFAVGARCTHYRGHLAEGLLVGETVRCPLHHACFSLRSGEPLRAPALDPIACWRVDREGDRIFVREKLPAARTAPPLAPTAELPSSIVIVGGGAAGVAAAEMVRRPGYDGRL